jgi:hypothetical protein
MTNKSWLNQSAQPADARNKRSKNGTVCDKAWHGENAPPAVTRLQCADCGVWYSRCADCDKYKPGNARSSMLAHCKTAHWPKHQKVNV